MLKLRLTNLCTIEKGETVPSITNRVEQETNRVHKLLQVFNAFITFRTRFFQVPIQKRLGSLLTYLGSNRPLSRILYLSLFVTIKAPCFWGSKALGLPPLSGIHCVWLKGGNMSNASFSFLFDPLLLGWVKKKVRKTVSQAQLILSYRSE
jgi:hypothetical protein